MLRLRLLSTSKFLSGTRLVFGLFSDESLAQKAKMNAIAAALDYGARLISGFLVTPFLVSGLGDTLYGVWRTLVSLTGYLSAASGRPAQALKWTTASQQTSKNYLEKQRTVGSSLIVWLLFLPLLATLGAVLAWFAPTWIKGLPPQLYLIVRVGAALLMFDMITTTLADIPQAVLTGENLGYKRMGLTAALVFVGGGLAVLALYLKTGLVGVAVAELTTTLITGLFFVWVVRSYVPWFGVARPSWKAVKRFFGLSGWFLGWRLVMQLMTASDLLILGMFTSAALVTTYSLTKYAPETMINIVDIVVFGVAPGLGGIIGAGDLRKAARVRGEVLLLSWLVAVTLGSTILAWNRTFVGLWVGPQRYAGSIPNILILILVSQFVLIRNDSSIIDLTLNISRKVLLGLLSAGLSILTAAVLVGTFKAGVIGLIVGVMIGRALLSVAYPMLIGRFLGVSLRSQAKSTLRPIMTSALLFFVASRLDIILGGLNSAPPTWVTFFFGAAVTVPLFAALAVLLGLSNDQQKRILQRVRQAVSKISV
jgi:O-antigen/teichoic acid export membrane protein